MYAIAKSIRVSNSKTPLLREPTGFPDAQAEPRTSGKKNRTSSRSSHKAVCMEEKNLAMRKYGIGVLTLECLTVNDRSQSKL
jgi:hypothetical protein